ncbi:EboA domain-containing protein [Promicromonospora sp. NPDC057138]|uniref:EboA domain-containing protein n=1 Tax=Promicromonospora sp. NPDC057138 TaxID=3346031 RepID=UPI003633FAD4
MNAADASPATGWLTEARAEIARDPDTVTRAFALAARRVGRGPRRPDVDPAGVVHGTVDDAARAALVVALADAVGTGPDCTERLVTLYRKGDGAERRGVLWGLDALEERGNLDGAEATELVAAGLDLAADALRTNDPSLVAAAVGPFGSQHLDQHTWRHAVLKLVFQGVSLDAVSGLEARVDDELDRMARDFAAERRAAGRPVPADLDRLTTTRPTNTPPTGGHPRNTRLSSTKE